MGGTAREFDGQCWTLAIFSSREDPARLMESVNAAVDADCGGAFLSIDVLVNGSPVLAAEMRARLAGRTWREDRRRLRLWSLPIADKAHTWNHYLHALLPPTDLAFFLDSYVKIERGALTCMARALRSRPQALAATSVPSCGRTSQALRRLFIDEGGLHGNFYSITGTTMQRLRSVGFRLPCGIYRNDSALGASLAFDLDPRRNSWVWDRIAVVPDAQYTVPVIDPLRPDDLRAAARRRWRQARGHLETRALKWHLDGRKRTPLEWPSTARELVLNWAEAHPSDVRWLLLNDPLAWAVLQQLRRQRNAGLPAERAECLGDYSVAGRGTGQRLAPAAHLIGR